MTQGKSQIYINWMDEYFDITVDGLQINKNADLSEVTQINATKNAPRSEVRSKIFLSGLGLSLRLFVPEAQKAGSPCGTHIPAASL